MKVIKLGLVAGRHPLPVQDYILQEVKDPSDIEGIHHDVWNSLFSIFEGHIKPSFYGPGIDSADDSDVYHLVSDIGLHLYVTGLTSVALEVVSFCGQNGVPLVAYHYNKDTGSYIPQRIF